MIKQKLEVILVGCKPMFEILHWIWSWSIMHWLPHCPFFVSVRYPATGPLACTGPAAAAVRPSNLPSAGPGTTAAECAAAGATGLLLLLSPTELLLPSPRCLLNALFKCCWLLTGKSAYNEAGCLNGICFSYLLARRIILIESSSLTTTHYHPWSKNTIFL